MSCRGTIDRVANMPSNLAGAWVSERCMYGVGSVILRLASGFAVASCSVYSVSHSQIARTRSGFAVDDLSVFVFCRCEAVLSMPEKGIVL